MQSDRRQGSSFRHRPRQQPEGQSPKGGSAADYFVRFVQKAECRFPCSLASGFLKQIDVAEGTLHATAPRLKLSHRITKLIPIIAGWASSSEVKKHSFSSGISGVPKQISPCCPEAAGGVDGPGPTGSRHK